MMAGVQAVIFDFDETLADTLPERIATVRETARQVLGRDVTPEHVLEVIQGSSNSESQMARLSDGDTTIAKQLLNVFRHRYYHPERAPLPLFHGMAEVLAHLQTRGIRLALVTSRHRTGANGVPTHGVLWEL